MKTKRTKKTKARQTKPGRPAQYPGKAEIGTNLIESTGTSRLAEGLAMAFLVILGLAYSLRFLGHFIFPSPDFVSFLDTGQKWLHFQVPDSMKRAPLFSIITVLAGEFFSRPDRFLLGTELYNVIMFPVALVLIYIVCRRFLGSAAVWVTLLAGISPRMIWNTSQPLVDITLVALIAATAICAGSKRIRLAYLFAMLASISRWDMVALIPAVWIVDIIRSRQWLKSVISAAIVSIPFIICMIITKIQLQGHTEGAHYLQVMAEDTTFELFADLHTYWRHICSFLNAPLLQSLPAGKVEASKSLNAAVFWVTAPILAISFLAGCILAVIRRQWSIIVLLIAMIPYVIVHAMYPYRDPRYAVPAAWIGLAVSAYAIVTSWRWFADRAKPKFLVPALQLAAAVVFILWAVKISDTLGYAQKQCPALALLVIVASVIVIIGFLILHITRRCRPSIGWLTLPAFLMLAVISSAVLTGFLMGDGQKGANFRRLGLWFYDNSEYDDKMVSTMSGFMPVYTGLPAKRFIHTGDIKVEDANDFPGFIRQCREENVTLIAWDSRLAGNKNDLYYKLWGLGRIEVLASPFLGRPANYIGPCKLVHIIGEGSPKIAVYRIISEYEE